MIHHLEPAWSWSVEKQECSLRLVNCNQFHIVFRHQSLQITAVLICNSIHMSIRNTASVDFPLYLLSQTMRFNSTFSPISKPTRDAILRSLAGPCPLHIVFTIQNVPPFKVSKNEQHCVYFHYSQHSVASNTGALPFLRGLSPRSGMCIGRGPQALPLQAVPLFSSQPLPSQLRGPPAAVSAWAGSLQGLPAIFRPLGPSRGPSPAWCDLATKVPGSLAGSGPSQFRTQHRCLTGVSQLPGGVQSFFSASQMIPPGHSISPTASFRGCSHQSLPRTGPPFRFPSFFLCIFSYFI